MENKLNGFEKIVALMPEEWEEKVEETGAITRSRKIKNASELLRLNLLYLTSGGSFGKTSAMLKLTEENSLNKNAVYERVKKSGEWLRWLCENICRKEYQIMDSPGWLENKRVCLIDATDESKRGSNYADYRMHYCIELFSFKMIEMHLTTTREGETITRFQNFHKDDIIIADRAYPSIKGILALEENQADYVLRFRANAFNLYDENHKKVQLSDYLSNLNEEEHADITLFSKTTTNINPSVYALCEKQKKQKQTD